MCGGGEGTTCVTCRQGSLVDGDVDVLGLERLHDDGLSGFGPGLPLGLLSLGVLFLVVQLEVRVVRDGPELVASEAPEDEGGELGEELSQPDILVVEGGVEQENDDAGEVNVGHHQQVELPEELQLLHVSLGFAIDRGSIAQVLDGPDDGHEDGTAADDVHETQHLFPGEPSLGTGGSLLEYDDRQDLQGDHYQEDILVLLPKEGLDEGPTGSDQRNYHEHHGALQTRENVVGDDPTTGVARRLLVVELDRFEQQSEQLKENDTGDQVVDAEDPLTLTTHEVEEPHAQNDSPDHEEHSVKRGQRGETGRQIVGAGVVVRQREIKGNIGPRLAVEENDGVEAFGASLVDGDNLRLLVVLLARFNDLHSDSVAAFGIEEARAFAGIRFFDEGSAVSLNVLDDEARAQIVPITLVAHQLEVFDGHLHHTAPEEAKCFDSECEASIIPDRELVNEAIRCGRQERGQ